MAGTMFASGQNQPGFAGASSIFGYTNHDGNLTRTNCGQAAAATLLTHAGKFAPDPDKAGEVMQILEDRYPPDQFFGFLGTGKNQFKEMCSGNGLPLREVTGRHELKIAIRSGRPVAVMLGVSAGKILNMVDLPGGHWMIAYGFDSENIYLTNWGKMTWHEFNDGWDSIVSWWIGMKWSGLAV